MRRTRRVVVLFLLFILILLGTHLWLTRLTLPTWHALVQWKPVFTTPRHSVITLPHRHFTKSSEKLILLWTDYFGHRRWDYSERFLDRCPEKRCKVTTDRKQIAKSDAVLFNSRGLEGVADLPKIRSPDQVWVLHNSEPPYYIFMNCDEYNGVFNWTSWYRRDADIFSPYGDYETRTTRNDTIPNFFRLKERDTYWAASSCTDRGRRYRMVAEIQRHMHIDTYGACGRLVCEKRSPKCDDLFQTYKFAFAFENGPCRDYVTEKFWRALSRDQVPVVFGGANYETIAPPGSYINIRDFRSARALADHLKLVGSNEKLYNSYFSWRKQYQLREEQVVNWCQLCTALHDDRKPAQVYRDLGAWVRADSCSLYKTWDQIQDNLARVWYLLGV